MARAGVLALEFFTPGKGSAGWGQAHMMARYAILRVGSYAFVRVTADVIFRCYSPLVTTSLR